MKMMLNVSQKIPNGHILHFSSEKDMAKEKFR